MKNLGKLLLLLSLAMLPVACAVEEDDMPGVVGPPSSGGGDNTLVGGVGNGGNDATKSANP
ncbi:hypothetical protein J7643_14945 [bacterium]|nr:hypothetical protein [bacterium]